MDKAIVYIDIESLMDLRQGFLVSKGIDREDIFNYIRSEEYNFRRVDELMEFTVEDYRNCIDSGDLNALRNSTITYTMSVLINTMTNFGVKSTIDGVKLIPEIWLNIHPFKLSKEETTMIRECLFETVDMDCFIEIISMTPEEFSPLMIQEYDIKACFIYNYSRWMTAHGQLLTEIERLDCDVMFPPMYQRRLTEEDEKAFKDAGFRDGFSYMEMASSIYFNLKFLPTVFYNSYPAAQDYINALDKAYKEKVAEDGKKYEDEIEEYLNEQFAR